MDAATTVPEVEVTESEEISSTERPLTRVPLVLNRRSYGWITERIAGAILHRAGDALGDPAVAPPIQYQRHARKRPLGGRDLLALSYFYFWYCGGGIHIQLNSQRNLSARTGPPA